MGYLEGSNLKSDYLPLERQGSRPEYIVVAVRDQIRWLVDFVMSRKIWRWISIPNAEGIYATRIKNK